MMKPLGGKSYGSIPHFYGSRLGPADHHCSPGQQVIATEKARDKARFNYSSRKIRRRKRLVFVKSMVKLLPSRARGYLAETSKYKTHHSFKFWVEREEKRFDELLNEGERVCGEWLLTAVGTKYDLPHEPFVAFDLINGKARYNYNQFKARLAYSGFVIPRLITQGAPTSIEEAMQRLTHSNPHGALEPIEGAIWRVERKGEVDFLCKYVRADKVDGKYLNEDIFNGVPKEFDYLKDYFLELNLQPFQQPQQL